jgi:hypothetical protein
MAGGLARRKPFLAVHERLSREKYLPFVPDNEQGTVYIFALVAKRLGFDVETVRAGFPDCLASFGRRRVRIEFEFRSKNFEVHGHDPTGCDLVVCWIHDWPNMPAGLQVIELRKHFGLAREVYVMAYHHDFWSGLPATREPSGLWSVPSTAGPGDILLIYRPAIGEDEGAITDVFRVVTPVERVAQPEWRKGADWMASIQRVASLRNWIPFSRMRQLGIHGGIEARPRRTDQWPVIYQELTRAGRPSHSLRSLAPMS